MKKATSILIVILGALLVLVLILAMVHQILLNREKPLREPLGQRIQVRDHAMSIYIEGEGPQTLVFMAGGGTSSPILDFKPLYSKLSDSHRIVVIEKFGYGFSDILDEERPMSLILSDSRTALIEAGIEGPFILCPHSMSGIEALAWAQEYPDEVSAIIGLDMATPESYKDVRFSRPLLSLVHWGSQLGITRIIAPFLNTPPLSSEDLAIYIAMFHARTATTTMLKEVDSIKDSASDVAAKPLPAIPTLLFQSNGDGVPMERETWQRYQEDFAQQMHADLITLEAPHYLHHQASQALSDDILSFLSTLE